MGEYVRVAAVATGWRVVIGLAVSLLLAGLLVHGLRRVNRILSLGPSFIFGLEVTYLLVLLALAGLYLGNALSVKTHIPWLIAGILPIGVPWFGAVGAVVIGLQGLFEHNANWDPSYNYWHVARPLVGAVLAIVALFLFLLLINATGTTPSFVTPSSSSQAVDLVVYYVVAFLVGYREETFRQLMQRATDLIFQPANMPVVSAPALSFEVNGTTVSSLDFGQVGPPGAAPVPKTVTVYNTGNAALTTPIVLVRDDTPGANPVFAKGPDQGHGVE